MLQAWATLTVPIVRSLHLRRDCDAASCSTHPAWRLKLERRLIVNSRVSAFVAGLLVLLSLLQPTYAGPSLAQGSEGARAMSRKPMRPSCAARPDTLQQMFVPLAHLRYFNEADIVLNNNGIDQLVARPTWFVHGGQPVLGRDVIMPPLTSALKRLAELLPEDVPVSHIDGLLIEYEGKMLELGAQVVLRPQSKPLAATLDVDFSMSMDFQSSRREATWTSGPGENAVLVIANAGGYPAEVAIASSYGARTVSVEPYQAQLVRLDATASTLAAAGVQAMWAAIDSGGVPGDLRVTGFVPGSNGARLIRFYDPSAVKQPHLFATGMRVANTRGDLALKNTSAMPLTARAQFLHNESGQVLVELPVVALGPNAARTIDLSAAMASLAEDAGSDAVSVRVESSGLSGALVGSLYVQDVKRGTLFDVPLRDSGGARSATGSYPWRIDGDYNTRVSITNTGTVPSGFVARVAYAGGELVFNPSELAAGASATFDLRALRGQRRKDGVGQTLPPGADHGRFIWTVFEGGQSARLIGRAEIVSARHGVSSSYSCGQCCPDSFVYADLSPFHRDLELGQSSTYTIVQGYQNCYGQQYTLNVWPTSWSVWTPSVASVYTQTYGVGQVTGNSGGETDLTANWGVSEWEPYIEDCIVDSWTNEQPARAAVCPVSPVTAYNPDPYPLDIAGMTQGTQTALTCLQNAVGAAGGSLTVTSAFRPQAYQDHIREVWDKWQAIQNNNSAACAQTKAQVQTEWNRHGLAFQPAAVSNHTAGNAFDATWNPGTLNIDQLAGGCNLSRSVPGDAVHFVH